MTIKIKLIVPSYDNRAVQSYSLRGPSGDNTQHFITGYDRDSAGLMQAEMAFPLFESPSKPLESLKLWSQLFYDRSVWSIHELLHAVLPSENQLQLYPLLWRDFQSLSRSPNDRSFHSTFTAAPSSIVSPEDLLKVRQEIIDSYGLDWKSARGLSGIAYVPDFHESLPIIARALNIQTNPSERDKFHREILCSVNERGLESVRESILTQSDGRIDIATFPFKIESAAWDENCGNPTATRTSKTRTPSKGESEVDAYAWQLPKPTKKNGEEVEDGGARQVTSERERVAILSSHPALKLIKSSRGQFLGPELLDRLNAFSFQAWRDKGELEDIFNIIIGTKSQIPQKLIKSLSYHTELARNFPSREEIQSNVLPQEEVLLRDEINGRICGVNSAFRPKNQTQEIAFILLQKAWNEIHSRGIEIEKLDIKAAQELIRSLNNVSDEELKKPESENKLREALKLAPTNDQALNQLAKCLYLQGKIPKSEAVCTRLIELGYTFAYEMRALRRILMNNLNASIEDLNAAIKHYPNNINLYIRRAEVRVYQADYAESSTFWSDCEKVLESGSTKEKAQVKSFQAMVKTEQGSLTEAFNLINEAIDFDSTEPTYYGLKLQICLRENNLAEAEKTAVYYKAKYIGKGSPDYYLRTGMLEEALGNTESALTYYQSALASGRAPLEAYYQLANSYLLHGRNEDAQLLYHRFLSKVRNTNLSENVRALRQMQPFIGEAQDAVKFYNPNQYIRAAIERVKQEGLPQNSALPTDIIRSKALYTVALTDCVPKQNYADAIKYLEESMELNPRNLNATLQLAVLLRDADPVKTIALYTKSILVLEQLKTFGDLSVDQMQTLSGLYDIAMKFCEDAGANEVAGVFKSENLNIQ